MRHRARPQRRSKSACDKCLAFLSVRSRAPTSILILNTRVSNLSHS
jgi:hypothetical protein